YACGVRPAMAGLTPHAWVSRRGARERLMLLSDADRDAAAEPGGEADGDGLGGGAGGVHVPGLQGDRQVGVRAAGAEGELADDRGHLGPDVGVLVRERRRSAGGERPQPGALHDQRDRARHVDDDRVGVLGGDRGPQPRRGQRDRAGVRAPAPDHVGAGERDDRLAPVVADQGRERHLGFLLRPVRVGLGEDGDDRDEKPAGGDRGEHRVLGRRAGRVGGEGGGDGRVRVAGVTRWSAHWHAPTLPPAARGGGGGGPGPWATAPPWWVAAGPLLAVRRVAGCDSEPPVTQRRYFGRAVPGDTAPAIRTTVQLLRNIQALRRKKGRYHTPQLSVARIPSR